MQSEDLVMEHALTYIRENACGHLNLKDLAARLSLSQVQFTRRFVRAFRQKPFQIVNRLRMDKAKRLLLESSLSLAEIAPRCGYQNEYYLSRVFKAQVGVSPSDYRRSRTI